METAALIPHMLEAFIRSDRGWRSRKATAGGELVIVPSNQRYDPWRIGCRRFGLKLSDPAVQVSHEKAEGLDVLRHVPVCHSERAQFIGFLPLHLRHQGFQFMDPIRPWQRCFAIGGNQITEPSQEFGRAVKRGAGPPCFGGEARNGERPASGILRDAS